MLKERFGHDRKGSQGPSRLHSRATVTCVTNGHIREGVSRVKRRCTEIEKDASRKDEWVGDDGGDRGVNFSLGFLSRLVYIYIQGKKNTRYHEHDNNNSSS